jgi:hypothetical protein
MKRLLLLSAIVLGFFGMVFSSCNEGKAPGDMKGNETETAAAEPLAPHNVAYKWGKIALEGTANDTERFKPRPTITSRILGLIFTSVFDAWTRYDDKAVPVYLSGVDRRPENERILKNKEEAISYAAYRTMCEYYFADSLLWRKRMEELGYDPDNNSMDPATPAGIGNLAAKTVIEARKNDGSNQYGEVEGANESYADYTGYSPINSPDENSEISRWQPKYFSDGKGGKYAPGCLTPHWYKVKPLALKKADQFRPGPPPEIGSEQLAEEVKEVVEVNANLTNEEKALVEFMRDGPKSVQQAGHWLIFAQDVSLRDKHTLDEDVKMYFLVEMTAMDAFIASWDAKMYYDFARPYALVHDYYEKETIKAWGGPHKGTIEMNGEEWTPYSPETFLCPPFPSYVSGHSTVSGGCAEALRLFKKDDHFGHQVKLLPGALTEPGITQDSVTLDFPTFTEAAEMAGWSRVLGGYHIQADNIAGLELGRDVAKAAWEKYLYHINGGGDKM